MTVIQRLDLITAVVSDADAALSRFRDDLGLPLLWETYDAGPYRSGAVHGGDAVLEVIQPNDGETWPPVILSFEPVSMAGLVVELDNRGIHHGGAVEVAGTRPDGSDGIIHTEIVLQGDFAGGDDACRIRLRHPAFELPQPQPGPNPAGIHGIERARIGTPDGAATIEIWQRLMVPVMFDGTTWAPPEGPHVGIEAAESTCLVGFFVQADDIEAAASALGTDADSCRNGVDVGGLRLFFY